MHRPGRLAAAVLLSLAGVASSGTFSTTAARAEAQNRNLSSSGPGVIPRVCPPGPTPARVTPVGGPAIGRRPVWAAPDGLWKGGRYLRLYLGDRRYLYSVHNRWGWGYKLLWLLAPRTTGTITIRGWNIATGSPMWFQIAPARIATTHAMLNPRLGSQLPRGWKFFSSGFEVPAAWCYRLEARWATGGWTIPFAVGLPPNYAPS
jgi:hypothetical protein